MDEWIHTKDGDHVAVERRMSNDAALMVGIKRIRFGRHGTGPVELRIETDKGVFVTNLAFGANTFRIGEK